MLVIIFLKINPKKVIKWTFSIKAGNLSKNTSTLKSSIFEYNNSLWVTIVNKWPKCLDSHLNTTALKLTEDLIYLI